MAIAVRKQDRRLSDGAEMVLSLDRRGWTNWLRLSGLATIAIVGLTFTVFLLLYPWQGSDYFLILVLMLIVTFIIAHLTQQQREIVDTRTQIQSLQHDVSEQKVARLYDLLNVSRIMNVETDSQNVFDSITRMCKEVFACEKASLMLYDEATQYLEVMAATGYADRKMIGARQAIGNGIAGWVGNQRVPVLLQKPEDKEKYEGLTFKSRDVSSAMVVPIVVKDELIGVLSISNKSKRNIYDEEDLKAVQAFGKNIGACINNAVKTREMNRTIRDQQRQLNQQYATGKR